MEKYIDQVRRGRSFVVVKKAKPVFSMTAPDEELGWEEVIDFTKINKEGVDGREVLKRLRTWTA